MPTTYAIPDGRTVMAATLYTGTTAAQNIDNTVNGVGFQPDFIWVKSRSSTTSHFLNNSVVGVPNALSSNTTAAEVSTAFLSYDSNGFGLNIDGSLLGLNINGASYVGWQWNAGGSTVTNTDGSISAQVRANPTAGFSVVTYTGTGANATVGHGLGVAPSMIIVKERSAAGDSWYVYHVSLGATNNIFLDSTAASSASATAWNNTAPTSTVFSLGTSVGVNQSTQTYVAYCFAAVAGYSAFGSYTGNGSADGPFVYLGFRPRFVLIKMSSGVAFWRIHDTSRNPYNVADLSLYPNANYADTTAVSEYWDILSNGFKLRTSDSEQNTNGATYIYAAFAENPFKYANAR